MSAFRLSALDAKFYGAWAPEGQAGRRGIGVGFNCPLIASGARDKCGCGGAVHVPFKVALDGSRTENPRGHEWDRTGDTIETLTLSPSVDGSEFGCFHGWIRDGEVSW